MDLKDNPHCTHLFKYWQLILTCWKLAECVDSIESRTVCLHINAILFLLLNIVLFFFVNFRSRTAVLPQKIDLCAGHIVGQILNVIRIVELHDFLFCSLSSRVHIEVLVHTIADNQRVRHWYAFRVHEVKPSIVVVSDLIVVEISDSFLSFHLSSAKNFANR